MEKSIGKVKFYNKNSGYGFIVSQDQPTDVFFHATATKEVLGMDDQVEFDVEQTKKGIKAINVKKV